jgi:sulfur relay (sulfurtransferase) DsrC/TusE family protein
MYAGKTVSYKAILDKTIRDFGFKYDIMEEEGIEWLAEFMAHTNVGVVLEEKIAYIGVCDGRADLPFDLHKIGQVAQVEGVESLEEASCGRGRLLPMRWKTDYFHKRYHRDNRDYTTESRETYTVGQGYIFPSFSDGMLAMSYSAIPTDECGYPTIPAEQQWMEAGAHFIAHKIARKLWLRNELTADKFQIIERDRDWYFAQAVNHAKQWQNVDEAESVKNSVLRTIPDVQAHTSFFANMQLPEQRKFRPKAGTGLISTINVLTAGAQGPNPATS